MKQLKTKKINIVICWNNLKNTPPKEFPTMNEMEKMPDLLDLFEGAISEFVEIIKVGEEMNNKIISGEVTGDDVMRSRKEWGEKSRKIEAKEKGKEIIVEFENEEFNTFFQQFERWGKNWFNDLREYLAFRKDLNYTNAQPKEKKAEAKK